MRQHEGRQRLTNIISDRKLQSTKDVIRKRVSRNIGNSHDGTVFVVLSARIAKCALLLTMFFRQNKNTSAPLVHAPTNPTLLGSTHAFFILERV